MGSRNAYGLEPVFLVELTHTLWPVMETLRCHSSESISTTRPSQQNFHKVSEFWLQAFPPELHPFPLYNLRIQNGSWDIYRFWDSVLKVKISLLLKRFLDSWKENGEGKYFWILKRNTEKQMNCLINFIFQEALLTICIRSPCRCFLSHTVYYMIKIQHKYLTNHSSSQIPKCFSQLPCENKAALQEV